VEPAPVRPAADAEAAETVAIPPTVPVTAIKRVSNLVRSKVILSTRLRN
jgi:hypothetical protein